MSFNVDLSKTFLEIIVVHQTTARSPFQSTFALEKRKNNTQKKTGEHNSNRNVAGSGGGVYSIEDVYSISCMAVVV